MARYIDAEALTDHMLERYSELCDEYGDWDHYATGYGDAIDVIENAPAADVVPKSEVAEIIDEAFKMMEDNFVNTPIYKVFPHRLKAELKKKYTE